MQHVAMSALISESERLLLRQFTIEDTDFILQLVNSAGWIRYIGDRNIKSRGQAANYLKNGPIKSYEKNGFGLWLVELKAEKRAIGMCGLLKRDFLDNVDIGFAFLPHYTGQGYAFEIAKETIRYAFDTLEQEKIAAICYESNEPSIKLLEKIGLKYVTTLKREEATEKLLVFEISKSRNDY